MRLLVWVTMAVAGGDEVGADGGVGEEGGGVVAAAGTDEEAEAAGGGVGFAAILRAAGKRDDEFDAAVVRVGEDGVEMGEGGGVEMARRGFQALRAADAGAQRGGAHDGAAEGEGRRQRVLHLEIAGDGGGLIACWSAQAEPGDVGAGEADGVAEEGEMGVGAAHEIARVGGRGHGRVVGGGGILGLGRRAGAGQ